MAGNVQHHVEREPLPLRVKVQTYEWDRPCHPYEAGSRFARRPTVIFSIPNFNSQQIVGPMGLDARPRILPRRMRQHSYSVSGLHCLQDGTRRQSFSQKRNAPHQDVHNFYARTAAEHGLIGLFLLFAILFRSFQSGWRLYRTGDSQFQRSIGLGFAGCVVAFSLANFFGDRWSYYVLGSYFWVLFGVVDASLCKRQATLVQI